jgi:molecular chaperone GrpE
MTRQRNKKGGLSADIPPDAVEEALRSVEKSETAQEDGSPLDVDPDTTSVGTDPVPEAAETLASETASLKAQLELCQEKARETLEKLKEEHDRFLRAAADLDNYRKRVRREMEESQKYANECVLKDLLPVIDNLDRALQAAPEGDPLAGGVRLVKKTLEDALARYGVKAFSALGEQFDPRLHEAVLQVPSADQAAGTVVLEHGRGFMLADRLVRPAMVGVAVAVPPEKTPDDVEPG